MKLSAREVELRQMREADFADQAAPRDVRPKRRETLQRHETFQPVADVTLQTCPICAGKCPVCEARRKADAARIARFRERKGKGRAA